MGKMSLELGLCALICFGFGVSLGKRKYYQLELERDCLQARNEILEVHNEGLRITNDKLTEANKLFTNWFTKDGEEDETEES